MWSFGSTANVLDYLKDIIQILILAWLFYRIYLGLLQTKATQIFLILIYYGMGFIFSYLFKLDFFLELYHVVTLPFILFLCVIYHPELRRAFSSLMNQRRRLFRIGSQTTGEQIDTILNACSMLVSVKRGALIVFPRHIDIKSIIDSGTKVNADLSSALILTIFDHDTPLHDGALIINGGRMVAASCYLPLSEQTSINASFGTRHRAALGLAEQSDAVIIVVSEETGAISLAYNANIYYNLDTATIKETLLALLSYHDVLPTDVKESANEKE
ncbi:MAG: TIGR00159 family protein [Spirochaetales bacterium]|nr:TIGR00159 family protein [Spirochaetales bacterium]